ALTLQLEQAIMAKQLMQNQVEEVSQSFAEKEQKIENLTSQISSTQELIQSYQQQLEAEQAKNAEIEKMRSSETHNFSIHITDLNSQIAELNANIIKLNYTKDNDVALLNIAGKSSSNTDTSVEDDVQNNINVQNVQKIINDTNVAQGININGNNNLIQGLTQDQSMQIL
ncbi:unnamed protein product, partial [Sphagnum balticum]